MPDRHSTRRPQFAPRPAPTSAQRRTGQRAERVRFLIVCEGEKTEPLYFAGFRLPGLVEVEAVGTGRNTQSLVAEAVRLRDEKVREAARRGAAYRYDQFWCVFDRDSFPADAFNSAIQQAEAAGFRVAYTNEAFELWYLLHFAYHDAALDRRGYGDRLGGCLGREYAKNDPGLYDALASRQDAAIQNAARLLATYTPHNPQQDNPCTTVHELVGELRKNAQGSSGGRG